jgi:hypothetical protein
MRAIREDLSAAARAAGFGEAWNVVPDDVSTLPAAVVGAPRDVEAVTLTRWRLTIPVTFFVSSADAEAAAHVLDGVLSVGQADDEEADVPPGFIDALAATEGSNWSTARFVSAETARYQMPGGAVALGCEVRVEIVTP